MQQQVSQQLQQQPGSFDQVYEEAAEAGDQDTPNTLYADHMRDEKIKNVISQISPEQLLEEIEHQLRGEKFDRLTQQWKKMNDKRTISEDLITDFMSTLRVVINQNTTLSNFQPAEINNIMEVIIDYTADTLTDNDVKYGLKGNYNEMTRIGNIVCLSCFTVFKRAINGMESRRIFSSLKVSEDLTQEKKKKWYDILKE